jgi:hypothetical protein
MFHNSRCTSTQGPGLATKAAIFSSKILKYCSSTEMKYIGRRINEIVAVIFNDLRRQQKLDNQDVVRWLIVGCGVS